jgi:DNA-binding XRE family transcriptional regulator
MLNIKIIENRRIELGWSKYEMADHLGLSRQAYYDIIKRKSTSLKTLNKIVKKMSLKIEDIIK